MKKVAVFLLKNRKFSIFSIMAILIVLVAIFAPQIAPHDPYKATFAHSVHAPSAAHLFGTDALGRDLFSRIIVGTRASVFSTLMLVAIVFAVGTSLGVLAGYFGGKVDTVIMRVADTMVAFPDLILAIAIVGILGPNMINAILSIAVVSWTKYARLSRSLVMKIRNCDYVIASRIVGCKTTRILFNYMLPNTLPTMVITAATDIGTIMLSLASLSFLGFGIQPPTPEWGFMLSEGRAYFQSSPWLLAFPGLAIFIVVMTFNLLGDSIRDLLDPREDVVEDTVV